MPTKATDNEKGLAKMANPFLSHWQNAYNEQFPAVSIPPLPVIAGHPPRKACGAAAFSAIPRVTAAC